MSCVRFNDLANYLWHGKKKTDATNSCVIVGGGSRENIVVLIHKINEEGVSYMTFWILWALYMLMVFGLSIGTIILMVCATRALWKWINTKPEFSTEVVEKKKLADVLKENRMRCKMTQEFVAESLGVSRQAVSKWENGTSDPSTFNLLALSKLYGISIDDVLKTQKEKNNR